MLLRCHVVPGAAVFTMALVASTVEPEPSHCLAVLGIFITSPDSSSSFYVVCLPSAPFNAQSSGLVRVDSGAKDTQGSKFKTARRKV